MPERPPTSGSDGCNWVEAEDKALVEQSLTGNTSAFGVLIGRYQKSLYNTALRMTGDGQEAKDITQAAFVKAFDRLGSFKPQHKFFSWLYRILINETLNSLRAKDRGRRLNPDPPSATMNPEEIYEQTRVRAMVQEALLRLSDDYRAAVLLRYYSDMSYREMACVLCVPEKTVKSRLYTARRILADLLRPHL